MTVVECGALLRSRQMSCVELLEQTLGAIERGEKFQSFITPMFDAARAEARQLDAELAAGHDRGPFHGIPIAHKDNYYTKGVRTTAGSLVFADFIPDYDADVVKRFREAGAICVGKTNMHELAFGITSKNPHYGSVRNPLDPERIAGGSSGGSAALVAAGLLPFATGSDTGGSIRVPASYCGIVGLKPTYGVVSRRGLLPLSFSLDCAGPLASTVEDCALALNVMAAGEFRLPALESLGGVRIGIPRSFPACIDLATLDRLGASISEVETPTLDELNAVARIVQMSETAALYATHTDASQFGADVWNLVQQGKTISAHEYVNAQRIRTLFRRRFDEIWREVDFLVTPTTPITAPLLTEDTVEIDGRPTDVRLASTSLVRSWNLTGEPAISIPYSEITKRTLPRGLQLIGPPFSEARLLQVAQAVVQRLQ